MTLLHRSVAILLITALPLSYVIASDVIFSGTLVGWPSCIVSDNGGRINVRFAQNIAVNRIDGERYRQAIPYRIDCSGADSNITWYMRLTLNGKPAAFDTTALKTSEDDLGIKVLLGGTALVPNKPREIGVRPSSAPNLEAVPVKRVGASLPSTEFTASALLMAELY
jgi:type 1 fimbria pilin